MIVGVGIDVVDVERFGESLERTPGLLERLFTDEERSLPLNSLAARFAAKEALAKALGAPVGLEWHDATVRRGDDGRPHLVVSGISRSSGVNSFVRRAGTRCRVATNRATSTTSMPTPTITRP